MKNHNRLTAIVAVAVCSTAFYLCMPGSCIAGSYSPDAYTCPSQSADTYTSGTCKPGYRTFKNPRGGKICVRCPQGWSLGKQRGNYRCYRCNLNNPNKHRLIVWRGKALCVYCRPGFTLRTIRGQLRCWQPQ